MAYSLTQHTNFAGSGATTIAGSFSGTPAVNSLVLVGLLSGGPNSPASSVTDNQATGGNTYAQIGATQATTGGINIQLFWTVAAKASGTFTITAHFGGTSIGLKAFILEYAGNATSSPNDVSNGTTGSSTTPASISITPSQANSLVIGLMSDDNADNVTITAGTNYTREEVSLINSTTNRGAIEDWIQTTATATTAPWTIGSSNTWAAMAAAFKPAATNPAPSVFDSSAVTESTTMLLKNLLSVSDSSAVTESTTARIVDNLSVFDASTVTDVVSQMLLKDNLSIFDSSAATEAVTMLLQNTANVFDSSSVSEAITITAPLAGISIFDSSTVTENLHMLLQDNLNLFDSSTVSESITITAPLAGVSVFDSSAATESIQMLLQNNASVFDSSTVSESITIQIPVLSLFLSVFDSSTVTESVSPTLTNFVSTFDASTVSENLQLALTNFLSVFDSSAVTENLKPTISNNINAFDSSTVSETFSVIYPFWSINTFDSSTVQDLPQIQPAYTNNAPFYFDWETGQLSMMLGLNRMPLWNGTQNRPTQLQPGDFGVNISSGNLEIWTGDRWLVK